jgi:hypothetical protein
MTRSPFFVLLLCTLSAWLPAEVAGNGVSEVLHFASTICERRPFLEASFAFENDWLK